MTGVRDVAYAAGVSVATVSRVLNESPSVRASTRARVEAAMRDLLYVPPGRQRTGVIGLLVPDLQNPIFPSLAQAIETSAAAAGFATMLCNTACSPRVESEYVHMLLSHGVDGMVFTAPELSNRDADHSHYARLLEQGARMVFVNGPGDHAAVPSVGVDEAAAGELAADHLLELGHRTIGFVAGPERYLPTREKAIGLRAALARRGLSLAPAHVAFAAGWTYEDGARAMGTLLDLDDRPTAVIASSDVMAVGALGAAAARGVDVPRDLSIVGFDGVPIGEYSRVPLTTIAQPTAEIARTAIDLLIQLIDEPARELPHAVFRPRLIVRGSTGPAPA